MVGIPCQPWRHGGNQSGIESFDGKFPIAAAKQLRKIRPIFFAVENVEGFIRHPHSTIIIKLFKWARSKMLWSQVRDTKDFSHAAGCLSF